MHLMTVSVLIKDRGLNQRAVSKTFKKRKMIRIIKLAGKSKVKLTQSCSLATNHPKAIRSKQITQARQQSGETSRAMWRLKAQGKIVLEASQISTPRVIKLLHESRLLAISIHKTSAWLIMSILKQHSRTWIQISFTKNHCWGKVWEKEGLLTHRTIIWPIIKWECMTWRALTTIKRVKES